MASTAINDLLDGQPEYLKRQIKEEHVVSDIR